ncbi:N-lysine methyltransferase KMT5A-A, partial [Clarias magur]
RGVFSCTDFDKGDFLLEYRGDLISTEECERRQRTYRDDLKVFMFEFRFNGKFLCVDAARDDGSLGRLVNDDHIKPNCRMKTIRVDGTPHLCLFAIRSISPGEEITYNYGDSEWPWRCKMTSSKNPPTPEQETADNKASKKMSALPSDSAACEELIGVTDETPSELQHSTHEVNSTSQSDVRAEVEESVVMESSVCAHAKTLEKVTLDMGQFSSEKQTYVEKKGGEKMSPVKEWLVNEELSFCSSMQGLEQMTSSKNPPTPEQETADDEASKKDCDHDVVISTISSMDKCAACVGPVVSFKWIGLRCRLCSSFWHKSCYLKHHRLKRSSLMRSVGQILKPVVLMKVMLRMTFLLMLLML